MKKSTVRILAIVLVALMCLSLLPLAAANAEEHVHVFEPITVPPTCGEEGYVQMICEACGFGTDILEFIPPTGNHVWDNVVAEDYLFQDSDNFCEIPQVYWKSCIVCGAPAEESYELAKQRAIDEMSQRRTNGEQHTDEEWNNMLQNTLDKIWANYTFTYGGEGHQWVDIEYQPATCEQDGWETYHVCAVCGKEPDVIPYIPATGHRWSEYTVISEPTCETDGLRSHVCSVCNKEESEVIPALGHKYGEFTVTKAPTCTEDGTQERVCSVCQAIDTEAVPALGHKYGAFTVTKPATCTEDGVQEHTCSVCGEKETEAIPAAHKYGEYVVTVEPGCYSSGEMVRTCTVCGETDSMPIPPEHKYGEFVVTMEPTCYSTGERRSTCTVCGEEIVEWIDMAHKYENGVCVFCGEADPDYDPEAPVAAAAQEPEMLSLGLSMGDSETFDSGEAPGPFTVYLDRNGGAGSLDSPVTKDKGATMTLPTYGQIYRQDHTLQGWNTDPNGRGTHYEPGATYTFYEDETLYAEWDIRVIYHPNGGTGAAMVSTPVEGDNVQLSKNTYTRPGYVFFGWNSDPNAYSAMYKDEQNITSPDTDLVLYAQWAKTPLEVSFEANGGEGTMPVLSVNWGDSLTLPANTFTNSDNTFIGWNTKNDGTGVDYANNATIDAETFKEDTILYAQWSKTIFKVSFNGNTADGGEAMDDQQIDTASQTSLKLHANTFTKTGYSFNGWNTLENGKGDAYEDQHTFAATDFKKNLVLYAQWKNDTVTVKFDANNGTGTPMPDQSINTKTDPSLTLNQNTFTREGYEFTGWNTIGDGSGKAYADKASIPVSELKEDITLYAQWKQVIFKVKYNANTGSGEMSDSTIDTKTEDSLTLKQNTFTKTDYVFVGWNTEANGEGVSYEDKEIIAAEDFTEDLLLYAQWKTAILFDGNGATDGSMTPQEFTISPTKKITLKKNAFSKTNYTFDSWNTQPDGSGTSYPDEGDYVASTSSTLYAQWVKTSYAVNYDKNGGGGTQMTPDSIEKDAKGTVKENTYNVPNTSKMFGEWNTEPGGTGHSYMPGDEIETTLDEKGDPKDITLYAQWKDKLDIWFNPGAATGDAKTIEEPKGSEVKFPTYTDLDFKPLSGQSFAGWKVTGDDTLYKAGDTYTFTSSSQTVTAQWADTIHLTYNANGGTLTTKSSSGTILVKETYVAPIPQATDITLATSKQLQLKRDDYEFKGWALSSSAKQPKTGWEAENEPITVNGGFEDDTEIFAVWEKHAFSGDVTISGSYSGTTGDAYVGETLTANITGEKVFTEFAYQWRRDGENIPGATEDTYNVTAADFGKDISCVVTALEASEGKTKTSNIKTVVVEEDEKRIVNNGQTEVDYVYGLTNTMYYTVNNGARKPVTLDSAGRFPVTEGGTYRFYESETSNVILAKVEVANWYTIGYANEGSGTVRLTLSTVGTAALTSSTRFTGDLADNIEYYPKMSGYNCWIVREGANIGTFTLTVSPGSGNYAHVYINEKQLDSFGSSRSSSSSSSSSSSGSSSITRTYTVNTPLEYDTRLTPYPWKMFDIIFNNSATSPRTADESHLGLWSALCLISLTGSAAILGKTYKRKKTS